METGHEKREKTELDSIMEMLLHWLRHWYYFVISFILALVLGILYLKLKTPEYQVNSKVSIRTEDIGGSISSASSVMRSFGLSRGSGGANVEDESNIMGSYGYMRRVVRELQLNNRYVLKGFLGIGDKDLYHGTPIELVYPVELGDTLSAYIEFRVDVKGKEGKVHMDAGDYKSTYNISFPGTIDTQYGSYTFRPTSTFDSYGDSYRLDITLSSYSHAAQIYQGMVVVDFLKKSSDIIILSLVDVNVPRGLDVLNGVIDSYNKEYDNDKAMVGSRTIRFLEERLDTVTGALLRADEAIERFKRSYNLTDIEVDAKGYWSQLSELEGRLLEAQTQLEVADLVYDLMNDPTTPLISFSLSLTDKGVTELINGYNELVLQRDNMVKPGFERSQLVQDYDKQIEQLRKNILRSLDNFRSELNIVVSSVRKKTREMESRMGNIPEIEKTYMGLKRDQEIQQTVYLFLQEKREEAGVKSVPVLPRLRIIDEPYCLLKPASPDLFKVMLMVLFFGGVLVPIAAIYILPGIFTFRKKRK